MTELYKKLQELDVLFRLNLIDAETYCMRKDQLLKICKQRFSRGEMTEEEYQTFCTSLINKG